MPDEARDPFAPDGADAAHSPDAWPPRPRPPADLRDRASALATRYGLSWARALVGVLVVVGVSLGGWWLLRPPAPPIEQTLPVASAETTDGSSPVPAAATAGAPPPGGTTTTATTAPTQVVAHAAGAVVRPGVYRLPGSARVDDLVRAAGGLAPSADANRVNLAAPVSDGGRVYVPAVGESDPPVAVTPDPSAPAGSMVAPGSGAAAGSAGSASSPPAPGSAASGPVDLNTADLAALDTLPGVGPATAQAIITYRQEHGRFRSVDELLEVRGIGDAKLAELRDRVTVGG